MDNEEQMKIGNGRIEVTVLGDGRFSVLDRAGGLTWRQGIPEGVSHVDWYAPEKIDDQWIALRSDDGLVVSLSIDGEAPDLTVEISATDDLPEMADDLAYPYPFLPPSRDAELVIPNRGGALYPAGRRVLSPEPFVVGGKELMMCWVGIVDADLACGMACVIDTPDDARMIVDEADGLQTPTVHWLPSMGRLCYTRRCLYHFASEGGYVAQAKYYRSYKIARGEFRTLREKAEQNPHVDALIGGANARIVHDGKALSREGLLSLGRHGVTKGSLCVRARDDEDGVITDEIVDALSGNGFLLTNWLTTKWVRTDPSLCALHPQRMDAPKFKTSREGRVTTKNTKRAVKIMEEDSVPEDGMPLLCARSYRGRVRQFIDRVRAGYVIAPEGFTATGSLKIDTLCDEAHECWHEDHPCTRSEWREEKIALLKELKEQGFVLSAEGGNDWGAPYLDTAYDPLGLHRHGERDIGSAGWSIRYPVDPKLGPEYDEFYFGAARRAPLYDLVYHDCVVSTFHDCDSNNIYYKTREEDAHYWRLKDLYQILHGQAPNLYLTVDKFVEEQSERIRETMETVCPWHEKVGYDEMVDHKYLTQNRMVQQTRFANGWTAVVNFSESETFETADGVKVGPLDYHTMKVKRKQGK